MNITTLEGRLRRIWLKDHDRSGGMADSADPGSLVRWPQTSTESLAGPGGPSRRCRPCKYPGMSCGRRLARNRLDPAINPATLVATALAGIGAEFVKCDRDSLDGRAQTGRHNSRIPLLPKR
jgi:hypothetical protein